MAIASFFATTASADDLVKLISLIPTIDSGVDKAHSIDEIIRNTKEAGFEKVNLVSVGQYVWPGFDKWITQTKYKNTWNKNWLTAYTSNLLDYYIIHATKSVHRL